jgi:hypothetical protein
MRVIAPSSHLGSKQETSGLEKSFLDRGIDFRIPHIAPRRARHGCSRVSMGWMRVLDARSVRPLSVTACRDRWLPPPMTKTTNSSAGLLCRGARTAIDPSVRPLFLLGHHSTSVVYLHCNKALSSYLRALSHYLRREMAPTCKGEHAARMSAHSVLGNISRSIAVYGVGSHPCDCGPNNQVAIERNPQC